MKKILWLLLIPTCSLAQPMETVRMSDGKWSLGAAYHYGFIIAHRSSIVALRQDHVKALGLDLFRQTTASDSWGPAYGFPKAGLRYYYLDLGNEEQLGKGHSLTACLDFNFSRNEATQFRLNVGFGLGYVTESFDQDENHKNIAIGTGLNGTFTLSADIHFRIAQQLFLTAGFNFNHFSNAATRTPNLGYNIPSGRIGLRRHMGVREKLTADSVVMWEKGFRHAVSVKGALKQVYPVNGPDYYVVSIGATSLRRFSQKSALGAGIDITYDHSLIDRIADVENPDPPGTDAVRIGLNSTYELIFDDLSVLLQVGRYLRSMHRSEGMWYHRVGMRYGIGHGWFVTTGLKTHFGKADYVDAGIGRRF